MLRGRTICILILTNEVILSRVYRGSADVIILIYQQCIFLQNLPSIQVWERNQWSNIFKVIILALQFLCSKIFKSFSDQSYLRYSYIPFLEKPWRSEFFQPKDSLNPQAWASHNLRDVQPSVQKEAEFSNKGTAMLPHLLVLNSRARTVFENLAFFANPQFTFAQKRFRRFRRIRSRIRRRPIRKFPQKRRVFLVDLKFCQEIFHFIQNELKLTILDNLMQSQPEFFMYLTE